MGRSGERSGDPARPHLAREIAVAAAGAAVYFGVRVLVEGDTPTAERNARRIIDLETSLGLDVEHGLQDVVLDNGLARTIGNLSYVWLHWPLLIVVLLVLFHRDLGLYHRLRNAMFASGIFGLVCFVLFPAAPPRFMPGFVGTVSDDARRHYLAIPMSWTNRYASFPSFHVGWTLIACIALATALTRRRHSLAAMVPAVLVGISVVTTGNHFVVDAVTGAAVAALAYWWFGRTAGPDPAHDHPAAPVHGATVAGTATSNS